MYIYLYIDVAMCLMALVEILRLTLMIIEKMQKTLVRPIAKELTSALALE